MAKGKKGKQKQELNSQPAIATAAVSEKSPKVHDDGVGMMEIVGHGSFPDDPLPVKAGASPTTWPLASPALGWGASASPQPRNDLQPMKTTTKQQKASTASKTVGWAGGWGDSDTGWGRGAVDGWGARIKEEEDDDDEDDDEWDDEDEEEEEWAEGPDNRWGPSTAASSWGMQPGASHPAQPDWKSWGKEAQRLSKTPSIVAAAPAATSNKPILSQQQHSQILNSLLSQPSAHNGYLSGAQQQQKLRQQQIAQNAYYQKSQSQPKQNVGAFASATTASKDEKSFKEPTRHQHSQSHDPWAAGSGGWGAANSGNWGKDDWGNDAGGRVNDLGGWGKGAGNWGKDASDWGEGSGIWGEGSALRGNNTGRWGGWGSIPEEDEEEYEEDDRRVHFTPRSGKGEGGWGSEHFSSSLKGSDPSRVSVGNLWGSEKSKDISYTMPSKTLAHAYNGTTTSLDTGFPRNKINEYTNVQFHDSQGAALLPAQQALFGRARKAKDRIHWMFPPNKDERVKSLLTWIETVSYSLSTYGLHRFLQGRERGALIANADYQIPGGKNEPAFDWLTFDQLQETRDKIMQESAAFYDPATQAIVFVFLPSQSGNSVAMWRRKINVPNNMRLMLQGEISLAKAALRREDDYIVHVDEYPQSQPSQNQKQPGSLRRLRRASLPSRTEYAGAYPMIIDETGKPKKKRKWWQFFRTDW